MKDNKIDSILKHTLLIGILAIVFSSAYYLLIFLPGWNNRKLELQTQEFNYKKDQDTKAIKAVEAKEVQNTIEEIQKTEENKEASAKSECSVIAKKNKDSFMILLEGCATQLCRDTVSANKDLQNFGPGFVQSCTQNKLNGVF